MIGTEKETSWESWFLEGGRSALTLGEDCGNCRLQFLAVAFNHPLVIGKGVLFVAVECAVTCVVDIDIDEAVTLGNLAGGTADQIDAAPGGIAEHLDAIQDDRVLDRLDVLAQIVDAVRIMNRMIGVQHIRGTQSSAINNGL